MKKPKYAIAQDLKDQGRYIPPNVIASLPSLGKDSGAATIYHFFKADFNKKKTFSWFKSMSRVYFFLPLSRWKVALLYLLMRILTCLNIQNAKQLS